MRSDGYITHYTHWLVSPDPDATGRAHSRLWQTDTEPLLADFPVDGLPAVHEDAKWETIGAEWEAHDMHAVHFRGHYGTGADGEQWIHEWADKLGMGNRITDDPYRMLSRHSSHWSYRNKIPSDGIPADEIWATIARYLSSDGANIGAVFMLRTVAIMQARLEVDDPTHIVYGSPDKIIDPRTDSQTNAAAPNKGGRRSHANEPSDAEMALVNSRYNCPLTTLYTKFCRGSPSGNGYEFIEPDWDIDRIAKQIRQHMDKL